MRRLLALLPLTALLACSGPTANQPSPPTAAPAASSDPARWADSGLVGRWVVDARASLQEIQPDVTEAEIADAVEAVGVTYIDLRADGTAFRNTFMPSRTTTLAERWEPGAHSFEFVPWSPMTPGGGTRRFEFERFDHDTMRIFEPERGVPSLFRRVDRDTIDAAVVAFLASHDDPRAGDNVSIVSPREMTDDEASAALEAFVDVTLEEYQRRYTSPVGVWSMDMEQLVACSGPTPEQAELLRRSSIMIMFRDDGALSQYYSVDGEIAGFITGSWEPTGDPLLFVVTDSDELPPNTGVRLLDPWHMQIGDVTRPQDPCVLLHFVSPVGVGR